MEGWQRKIIDDNLNDLVRNTKCTVGLLNNLQSRGALTESEVENMRLVARTSVEQGTTLYKIMQTRSLGYNFLLCALQEERQTGASSILQKPLLSVNNTDSAKEHQKLNLVKIEWRGKTKTLGDVFPSASVHIYKSIFKNSQLINDINELLLNGEEPLKLTETPTVDPIYMQRKVSCRLSVDPRIFTKNCSDIFVLYEGDYSSFQKICHPHIVRSSETQRNKVDCRHIYLLHEEHLEDIYACTEKPIHVIQNIGSEYILFKSTQMTETLKKYTTRDNNIQPVYSASNLDHVQANDNRIYIEESAALLEASEQREELQSSQKLSTDACMDEHNLVKLLINETKTTVKGVCICDNAGMGKTWLLHKISALVKTYGVNVAPIFLNLFSFSSYLSARSITEGDLLQNLLKYSCSSRIAAIALEQLIKNKMIKLLLICDGYDEIWPQQMPATKMFLSDLVKTDPNIKICISSRAHFRTELEKTFMVNSYDLLPFSSNEQARAIVAQWRQMYSPIKGAKLFEFAMNCANTVRKVLNSEILGTPLMCFMLSKIHQDQAKRISAGIPNVSLNIDTTSVLELFQKYIDRGWERLKHAYGAVHLPHDAYKQLICYHEWKALKMIYPDGAERYYEVNGLSAITTQNLIPEMGILIPAVTNSSTEEFVFVHSLFAEYFVANLLTDFLHNLSLQNTAEYSLQLSLFADCFRQTILSVVKDGEHTLDYTNNDFCYMFQYKFLNHNIVWFLDSSLDPHSIANINPLIKIEAPKRELYQLLLCCARNDFALILITISKTMACSDSHAHLLHHEGDANQQQIDQLSDLELSFLLCTVARQSSIASANEIFEISKTLLTTDLLQFCKEYPPTLVEPIVEAIERNSLELVNFYSDKLPLNGIRILPTCLKFFNTPENDIKTRKEICNLLIRQNRDAFLPDSIDDRFGIGYYDIDIMHNVATNNDFSWTQMGFRSKVTILLNVLFLSPTEVVSVFLALFLNHSMHCHHGCCLISFGLLYILFSPIIIIFILIESILRRNFRMLTFFGVVLFFLIAVFFIDRFVERVYKPNAYTVYLISIAIVLVIALLVLTFVAVWRFYYTRNELINWFRNNRRGGFTT